MTVNLLNNSKNNIILDDPIIKIKNLSKSFGSKIVLNNVNLQVNKSHSVAIIGASGGGKSVLIKHMIGLLLPTSGDVIINGTNVTYLSQKNRLKLDLSLGMLFQNSALFDSLTVLENVVFPITIKKPIPLEEQKKIAKENLTAVGLDESIFYTYPSSLSGGMRKRVALARLLSQKPKIMFFDEPTTGLDPITSMTITLLIKKVTQSLNATSITISHDINSVCELAENIFMLHNGSIYWQGTPNQLIVEKDPVVSKFILGK